MSKVIFLSFIFFGLVISSCNSENKVVNDPTLIIVMDNIQNSTLDEFLIGQEKSVLIKEKTQDRSNPAVAEKATKMYKSLQKIDEEAGRLMSLIEKGKKEMFKELGEEIGSNKESILRREHNKNYPLMISWYSLEKVRSTEHTDILDKESKFYKELQEGLLAYRKLICSELALSFPSNNESKPYFFNDPNLTDVRDHEKLSKEIQMAIENSNVANDDKQMLQFIYFTMTFTIDQLKDLRGDLPWINAFGALISIQNEILKARTYTFRTIASRFSFYGDHQVSAMEPIVFGPEIAYEGEEVKMEVTVGGSFSCRYKN